MKKWIAKSLDRLYKWISIRISRGIKAQAKIKLSYERVSVLGWCLALKRVKNLIAELLDKFDKWVSVRTSRYVKVQADERLTNERVSVVWWCSIEKTVKKRTAN